MVVCVLFCLTMNDLNPKPRQKVPISNHAHGIDFSIFLLIFKNRIFNKFYEPIFGMEDEFMTLCKDL